MRKLGNRVQSRRVALGLTIKELAALCGVALSSLSFLERGRIYSLRPYLILLAEKLGMSIDELLEGCADKADIDLFYEGIRKDGKL